MKIAFCKFQILLPIQFGDIVFACTHVIAQDAAGDRAVQGGHSGYGQTRFAEKRIDSACFDGGEELGRRIRRAVQFSAGNVKRPRRDQGREQVAIDRHLIRVARVFMKIAAEPVREGGVEVFDGSYSVLFRSSGSILPVVFWLR